MLFLDACAIIYLVEATPDWADRLHRTLSTLDQPDSDRRLATSDLSRLECRVRPLCEKRESLLATYDAFFARAEVEVVALTASVVDLATAIRARSGLRTPDALQAACCLSLGSPARFITNDSAFKREAALDVVLI